MKKLVNIKAWSIFLIFLVPAICLAGNNLDKANKLYDNLAYAEAVPQYLKALKSNPNNSQAIFRIAHCYRLINDMSEAEKWYSKAVQLEDVKPAHLVYYTEALMSNGNYSEAEKWIKKYKEIAGTDTRTDRIIESLSNINSFNEDSSIYSIRKLTINSTNADCSPVIYNKGIVFSSSRRRIEMVQRVHEWTDLPFFTLYYAKGERDNFKNPEIFSNSITTKYNNATICFNKAGDELYVTRNNIIEESKDKEVNEIMKLSIYHFIKSGSKWIDETSFQYNNDQYNCAHPCLSPDGNKLYFASDMPGGFGGMDLYVCIKNGTAWDKPENLGPTVNTSANECFPFIDTNNDLYFASNGRGGLGGFDIYFSSKAFLSFSEPFNLGYPINSPGDDFGLVQIESGKSGYFSSNRVGKGQNDDIYLFDRLSIPVSVLVYDTKTKMPLIASTVEIKETGKPKRILTTSDKGMIYMFLTPGKTCKLSARKEQYNRDSTNIETKTLTTVSINNISIGLRREITDIKLQGTVYNSSLDRKPIANAKVSFINRESGEEISTMSGEDGSYRFDDLVLSSNYNLAAKKKDGVSYPIDISTEDFEENKTLTKDIVLNSALDIVKVENIFYDLNKYDVRPDAEKILDRLVDMMKTNAEMKIELRSHTDCRQTDDYNMKLSQRRAKSVVSYMIKHGISSSRLSAKGYGKTMLINNCDCDATGVSPCEEKEHQENRRTEFKILTLD